MIAQKHTESGKAPRRLMGCGLALGIALLLGGLGYFVAAHFIGRYLEGEKLRTLIAGRVARELGGEAGLAPMSWRRLSVYSEGMVVAASPPRALSELRAEQLFARCSLSELWHGKWRVNHLSARHLQVAYGAAAARQLDRKEFRKPEMVPAAENESPIKVDIREVSIARTDLLWGDPKSDGGQFREVQTNFYPDGKNLVVHGSGGTFHQAKWPEARVISFKAYYAKPSLRIDEANLTLGGDGTIRVQGGMQFDSEASMDLQFKVEQSPIGPFLSEAERVKVKGTFDGDAHVKTRLGKPTSLDANGSVAIRQVVLDKMVALEKAAAFTGKSELSPLRITEGRARYEWHNDQLTVRDLYIEAKGTLCLQGSFAIKEGEIDGTVQLGVAPEIVDKFPGARKDVFTREDDGYLWTPVKLSGPFAHPRDDLKPRLVKAVENHIAGGLLKPLLKPAKAMTDVIEALLSF
ncbi:MAG: hypothetical protein M3N48_06790 [Verrucomicrobiota bacterium]|nr:hypothetical protein [Verrucomicrobiota bacterium]